MQSARFHKLRDRCVAAVDHAFAEPIEIRLFPDGSQYKISESTVQEIEAVLRVDEGRTVSPSGSNGAGFNTGFHSQKSELHIDRIKYPDLLVKKGDTVRALARPGQPRFEVSAVDDRGSTRLVLRLGAR